MAVAKVELTLGAKPPTLNRVIVNGLDLAGAVSAVKVHADPQGMPVVSIEIVGEQLIKADALVRIFIGRGGMRRILNRYHAQHTEACRSNRLNPDACLCGLNDLLNSDSVEIVRYEDSTLAD